MKKGKNRLIKNKPCKTKCLREEFDWEECKECFFYPKRRKSRWILKSLKPREIFNFIKTLEKSTDVYSSYGWIKSSYPEEEIKSYFRSNTPIPNLSKTFDWIWSDSERVMTIDLRLNRKITNLLTWDKRRDVVEFNYEYVFLLRVIHRDMTKNETKRMKEEKYQKMLLLKRLKGIVPRE